MNNQTWRKLFSLPFASRNQTDDQIKSLPSLEHHLKKQVIEDVYIQSWPTK